MNIRKFFKGDPRSVKAKKNIIASIVLKGIDSIIYLLLVPVTLGYLNPYEYGIWLTINSILMWINSFDIGLGNGMRNRLTEAIANKDLTLGRTYVSTTFYMLIFLMGGLILFGTLLGHFINWYDILSTTPDKVNSLKEIVYISFLIFCINFIFKFIGNVYLAMQMPAINNAINVSGHMLSLLIIFILTKTSTGNLFWVAVTYSASPLIIYLIAYPITFLKVFPYLKPTFSFYKKQYLKDLLNIGIQFFLLQLSGILLFAFANILISHIFGPENVTPYNISYRYFSILPMFMNLILAPMWSATTDAYARGDMSWIKRCISKFNKLLIFITIGLVIMVTLSNFIYRIWIGDEVKIPLSMSILMAIYEWIIIISLTYSNFLNGLGKLKIQTLNILAAAILFIPLCLFLCKHWNINGVIISMCLINTSGLILNYIQLNKILNNRAVGIWNQ